jgi:hypothetical protein
MATDISRLGLGALIVRAWRIKLARIVMKLAGGLTTLAERLLPEACARESPRLFFNQARGCITRRHQAGRPWMYGRPVLIFCACQAAIGPSSSKRLPSGVVGARNHIDNLGLFTAFERNILS